MKKGLALFDDTIYEKAEIGLDSETNENQDTQPTLNNQIGFGKLCFKAS